MSPTELETDDQLKLELLRVTEALGIARTERLVASIRRSLAPQGEPPLSWAGQTQATKVVREWINTYRVEYVTQDEAWEKTGDIILAYLTGSR